MSKKGTPFNLEGFVQNPDGSYSKKKTVLQPREKTTKIVLTEDNRSITPKMFMDTYKQTGQMLLPEHNIPKYHIEFPVDPIGKPRMTQVDKWHKRPATDRYWELKAQMKQIAEGYKFTLPESNYHMIFYIPMPDSWPKKKKLEMDGQPHKQKPDKDNLEKGVLDALCKEDSYVWDGRVTKYWAFKGKIVIKNLE